MSLQTLQPMDYHSYFMSKSLPELSVDELVFIHLRYQDSYRRLQDVEVASCLTGLIDTLSASFNNVRTKQYVPLMTAFAILDQIGTLYSDATNPNQAQNGIKRALLSFTQFPPAYIDDLVTLRHGLFHDGSLLSRNTNTGTDVLFRMVKNSGKVLTPPKITWDGIYRDQMEDYVTRIDLKELQDLIHQVLATCKTKWKAGQLRCSISDPKEFYYKFLFTISRVPQN